MSGSVLILHEPAQLECAALAGVSVDHYVCSTRAAFAACQARGLDALRLTDEVLSSEARAINTLALESAQELIEKFPAGSAERSLLDADLMLLRSVFVHVLKCARILQMAHERWGVRSLTLFNEARGLSALVYREYAALFEPGWQIRLIDPTRATTTGRCEHGLVSFFRRLVFMVSDARGRGLMKRAAARGGTVGMLSGGLNHLAPVIAKLRSDRRRLLIFAENTFNAQKFMYCLKNGLAYVRLAPGAPGVTVKEPVGGFVTPERLRFAGKDLSELADRVLRKVLGGGWFGFSIDPAAVRRLIDNSRPDFILLDEDMALRRVIALEAERAGTRCTVISHGVPGVLLEPQRDHARPAYYRSAPTIVHSEFEEHMYAGVRYDTAKLVRSGVPRYDRLVGLRTDKEPATGNRTVLYCGAHMREYDFDEWLPWLGLTNVFGEMTQRYASDLLKALRRRRDVSVEIKPHFNDEKSWQASLKKFRGEGVRFRILSHHADTFERIARADLVIAIESSVVAEAVMLGKPVILLNYTSYELMADYHLTGVADCARTPEQFQQALERCLDEPEHLARMAEKQREAFGRYAGPFDGRGAERAARLVAGDAHV